MLYIGCHVSSSKGYVNMLKDTLYVGGNTFQWFTRNPRGGDSKPLDMNDVNEFNKLRIQHSFGPLVAHAPYTINAASSKEEVRVFAEKVFEEDIKILDLIPNSYLNFHPGSHVGQGAQEGTKHIVEILNKVIKEDQKTIILLETMAGKGSEIGRTFEELKIIIDQIKYKDKIGVCLDTCHVFDGGYDIVSNLENVLDEFDKIIGLDKLKAIHMNDSKNLLGSHKDRHELIGKGNIGLETMEKIINNPRLKGRPIILETPNDLDGYKEEITLLKSLYKGE